MELAEWSVTPLSGGFARDVIGGGGALRLSGIAHADSEALTWSIVVKSIQNKEGIGSKDPRAWDFWQREVLAYDSGLLSGLSGGLMAPSCYGITSHAQGEYWIWMEDVDQVLETWPLSQYEKVARHLGEFSAFFAEPGIPHDRPWFVDGRAENWIEWQRPVLENIDAAIRDAGTHWYSSRDVQRIKRILPHAEAFEAILRGMPRTLCHHDAFRRNLIAGSDRTTAIDWQILGTGAIGEEIMPLVGVTLQFLDVHWGEAKELEGTVLDAYCRGLADGGRPVDTNDVKMSYLASVGLMIGLANVAYLKHFKDNAGQELLERNIGRPFGEISEHFTTFQSWAIDCAEEALDAVGISQPTPRG